MRAHGGKRKPHRRVRIRLEDDIEEVGYPRHASVAAMKYG
jgi:hypothetical protein